MRYSERSGGGGLHSAVGHIVWEVVGSVVECAIDCMIVQLCEGAIAYECV